MPGPVGTEGARPTNRAKDIFSGNLLSFRNFPGEKNFSGGIFGMVLEVFFLVCGYGYVVWLLGGWG